MTKPKIIRGSGAPSPPTPPQPTRAPDTLHSRQFATFLDLVSEGEIEGFATASKEGRTQGTTAYNNAALIAGAFFVPQGLALSKGISTGFGFAKAGVLAKSMVYLGAGLTLQGVSEMLFPLPKPKEFSSEQDPRISFGFSGTSNTSRAGTPVPLVYGEIITGAVVISGAVDTQQVQA